MNDDTLIIKNFKEPRNLFKIFPWKVIDKSRKTSHPLWFKTYDDLIEFYAANVSSWKDYTDSIRIVKTDESGKEVLRYAFEDERLKQTMKS